jgi:hypothetical protein
VAAGTSPAAIDASVATVAATATASGDRIVRRVNAHGR